jgi:hypothetical protein
MVVVTTPLTALAQPKSEAAALIRAKQSDKKRDWSSALTAYSEALAIKPSLTAQAGVANAQYQLQHVVEAYEAYDELLKMYGAKLSRAQQAEAEARLKEASAKTGSLSIRVDEAGASVLIDDVSVGTTPLPMFKRVHTGTRRVRIVKEGFVPFEEARLVGANAIVAVEARLVREAIRGRLAVREASGKRVVVVVDGAEVGSAPWEGEVDPGKHSVMVRGDAIGSNVQTFEVVRGQRQEAVLTAIEATAHLEVRTSDGAGTISIDGKVVGEGSFSGEVGVGPHKIDVSREGFEPFHKAIALRDKESASESVTLRRPGESFTDITTDAERLFQGVYGGFNLMFMKGLGTMGTELELKCGALSSASCETPGPLGGGLQGYVGYTWNPVGFELMLGGSADVTEQKATYDGKVPQGGNPLFASPVRTETFTTLRAGGFGAVRLRLSAQTRGVRFSFAAGFGGALRVLAMQRAADTPDGGSDRFVPGALTYLAPAASFDLSVHWRVGRATTLALGGQVWAENAGDSAKTARDASRYIVKGSVPVAVIPTPSYSLASGTQVLIGPYIGMQFGP